MIPNSNFKYKDVKIPYTASYEEGLKIDSAAIREILKLEPQPDKMLTPSGVVDCIFECEDKDAARPFAKWFITQLLVIISLNLLEAFDQADN